MDVREARDDANWAEQAAWAGPFSRKRIGSVITPRLQELILLPTEKCNFRCTYAGVSAGECLVIKGGRAAASPPWSN
ncbi:hypothetical protein ACN2C7_17340 [Caulobacter sp. ErkDOM-E]|uniref:hypothetical protein n=1 Tax=Caulobacter sp. ErkDOM-E TaxID=3402778 RepID=UPI003AF7BFEE